MMWLSPNLHRYFDAKDWALVPPLADLEAIERACIREFSFSSKTKFTKVCPRRTRNYDFAHFKQSTEPLLRFVAPACHSVHLPPYATLSPICSHVNPYFVICNIAEKDKQHFPELNASNADQGYEYVQPDVLTRIRLCRTIYDLWTSQMATAEAALENQHSAPPSLHSNTHSAHSSTSRRSNPERNVKRKRNDNQADNSGSPVGHSGAASLTLVNTVPTPREAFDVGGKLAFQAGRYQAVTEPYLDKVKNWLLDLDLPEYPRDSIPGRQVEAPRNSEGWLARVETELC
ncbi:hypothetical protein RSAG8_07178, partial [Rhizoctonia solani AG-8 WAC10335]